MNSCFAFLPGGSEWIIIVLVILLLFGPKKLPELARGIGRGLAEFRKAKEEFDQELQDAIKETEPQQGPQIKKNPAAVAQNISENNDQDDLVEKKEPTPKKDPADPPALL